MKITFSEGVLPEILEALGYEITDNGYIAKDDYLVQASDGEKIHYREVGMIKKNEENETVLVRDNFAEYVNEIPKTEQEDGNEK